MSSAKSRIHYKQKMAVGSAGRQRDGNVDTGKGKALQSQMMWWYRKCWLKILPQMCFERNLGFCLNQFFVCVKCAYAPWKQYVLAELPTAEILLWYCLQSCSSFFMSPCSAVVAAPPAAWWPSQCCEGLQLLTSAKISTTIRPTAWGTLQW